MSYQVLKYQHQWPDCIQHLCKDVMKLTECRTVSSLLIDMKYSTTFACTLTSNDHLYLYQP